jgi:hypothetical protein
MQVGQAADSHKPLEDPATVMKIKGYSNQGILLAAVTANGLLDG